MPTKPTTYNPATMDADFTYDYWWDSAASVSKVKLIVSPTVVNDEAGTYVIRTTVCLTDYITQCGHSDSNVVITACAVSSVQIVESPGLTNL